MLSKSTSQLIVTLHNKKGVPKKKIARALDVSISTVRRHLNGYEPRERRSQGHLLLAGHHEEVKALFVKCEGNCPPVLKAIQEAYGRQAEGLSLRTLQRYCKPLRRELKAVMNEVKGGRTRFETEPGMQIQIDFATAPVLIGGEKTEMHFFVSILGYSRRIFVKAYLREKQDCWLNGVESAFRYFGGSTIDIVSDNARALVAEHGNRKELRFTERYQNFCDRYGVHPVATGVRKPYSKGKVERAVRYLRDNFLAGYDGAESVARLNEDLAAWAGETDKRRLRDTLLPGPGTPAERWKKEWESLSPISGLPPIEDIRQETRVVAANGLLRVDSCQYSLGRRFAGRTVQVEIGKDLLVVADGRDSIELDKAADQYKPSFQKVSTRPAAPLESQEEEYGQPSSLQRPPSAYDCLFTMPDRDDGEGKA